ncbi:hypothetical protein COCC4DRAFT_125459 [Bipolaris maydis ATCC 48331]|uniref:F-box domain-containing protein n=2 Tax=Cochliobolus heterostrophus TaxID=5016 RepID=M2U7H5_COCH5|nr:uncharacterized protein COCC4DRAFT_125459 [Bipolaris maydis ATCC 48331]EMD89711.1 hypothetical protein COCHEDRAFT_1104199 [Bipolaris maydis C5]ENI10076.1 hypothetical protein COCC4DRAFT_125459 [Bipolaris maydis ATCC 48331]KAJ5025581.1 hypothetical protein J3E73DRAFT_191441 [Bipolaris maydis]KAJ6207555.1 hypothetical protein PSV09DRAFT_1104199 [Bipolaris maydis]
MSFSKLSTELDTKILEYLHDDRSSLSAMSMVSKYFRRITEPILYRDLCFPQMTTNQMKKLLTIVLSRPQLAKHVRSLTMVPERESSFNGTDCTPSEEDMEAWNRLHEANHPALLTLSEKLETFSLSPQFVQDWFSPIFNCTFLDDRPSLLDPFLAVFLILATNIETINLTATAGEVLRRSRAIFSVAWSRYPVDDTQQEQKPFKKLSDLCIANEGVRIKGFERIFRVWIPSCAKRLRLSGWEIYAIDLWDETVLPLQHLDLRNATVSPADLTRCLETGQLANLRHLNLDGIQGRFDPAFGRQFDGIMLGRTLALHTPSLEVLEMRTTEHSVIDHSFDIEGLVGLTKLHTLRIDIEYLVLRGGSGNHDPIHPHRILPASLWHLEFTQVPVQNINAYCLYGENGLWPPYREGEQGRGSGAWSSMSMVQHLLPWTRTVAWSLLPYCIKSLQDKE